MRLGGSATATAIALSLWCGSMFAAPSTKAPTHREPSTVAPQRGTLTVATYNVAGLPEGLSLVHPVRNLPLIGAALDRYDVALVQEDYAYPALLRSRVRLPHASPGFERGDALHFGDGLSQFAK